MTRFEHYSSGQLYGVRYWFDQEGDDIPEHAHPAPLSHNIVVLAGEIRLLIGGEQRVGRAGDILDFDWAKRHRIVACGPAAILNLFLCGMPDGYDRLPQQELKGTLR